MTSSLLAQRGEVAAVELDAARRSGCSRPMISLSSTVLPQPLSPMMQTVSPRSDRQVDVAQDRLLPEPHASASSSSMIRLVRVSAASCAVAALIASPRDWGQMAS